MYIHFNTKSSLIEIWFISMKELPSCKQSFNILPNTVMFIYSVMKKYLHGEQCYYYYMLCVCMCAKLLRSCLIICDPRDCSLLVSSVHGILQTRILEWFAMPSYRGFSQPRDQSNQCLLCLLHWQADSLPLAPTRKPIIHYM